MGGHSLTSGMVGNGWQGLLETAKPPSGIAAQSLWRIPQCEAGISPYTQPTPERGGLYHIQMKVLFKTTALRSLPQQKKSAEQTYKSMNQLSMKSKRQNILFKLNIHPSISSLFNAFGGAQTWKAAWGPRQFLGPISRGFRWTNQRSTSGTTNSPPHSEHSFGAH